MICIPFVNTAEGITMASDKIKFWSILFAALPVAAILIGGGLGTQ